MSSHVLFIAMECKPHSMMGGVALVAGELPSALFELGVNVEVVTPSYGQMTRETPRTLLVPYLGRVETVKVAVSNAGKAPVFLLENKTYFGTDYSAGGTPSPRPDLPLAFRGNYARPYVDSREIPYYDDAIRAAFFAEACLEMIRWRRPDVVHINDWLLCPLFARMIIEGMPQRRVLSVHNCGYQGNIGRTAIAGLDLERIADHPLVGPYFTDPRAGWSSINALRLGLELADKVNTVSPTYKREMTQPEDPSRYFEGGKGLEFAAARLDREGRLHGILNGFEYAFEPTKERFDESLGKKAEAKRVIAREFSAPDGTLIGFVGRAVEQKFKLLAESAGGETALDRIVALDGVNVAIVATGQPEYEAFLRRFAGRPNVNLTLAFDRGKAAQVSLGSDLFLMPSLFEPCGITQMESMSFATPPIVRLTGGLADTVVPHPHHTSTGFGFDGGSRVEIVNNLVETVRVAVNLRARDPAAFLALQWRGFQNRFLWSAAAQEYISKIYLPI